MRVGDTVRRRIEYGMEGGTLLPEETGKVIYVHPKGLFYTAEFTFDGPHGPRTVRQSYPLRGRITSPVWGDEED